MMSPTSLVRLLTLAALWGGSFLFMRIAANPLGPVVLIEARVGFAAITLLVVAFYLKNKLKFTDNIKHFFILGLFNSALPFLLFAYSAQFLNVSTLAILNSTSPIWAAIIGAFMAKKMLPKHVSIGLILGIIGVSVLVGWQGLRIGESVILPITSALMAALSYGIATNYAKNAPQVKAYDNAHGSLWASVIIILPLLPFFPVRESLTFDIFTAVLLLGVFCTGLAYLLYFRLIADLGAPSALSVTFLIPLFGILWGHLFLDEVMGLTTLIGSILVITGTVFVTGFSPRTMVKKKGLENG
jgi:drug/metabolite transporter (DMT)-like permease